MSEFTLPAAMRAEIIAHAREEFPRECCGLIITASGTPVELLRMRNLYDGIDFYEIDGAELFRLYRECDERGQEIGAIYHSHPVSPPFPSQRDIAYAGWEDAVYLICSLGDPESPDIRAFRIVDGAVTELSLVDA